MKTLIFTVMFVTNPGDYCPTVQACSRAESNTIYMVERDHLQGIYTAEISLEGIHFPHFASLDMVSWRRAGQLIAERAGIPADFNDLGTLAHEVKHLVYCGGHNQ